jgi:peptidoglycan glycosyltransferase
VNKQIRWLAAGLLVCFTALFVQMNLLQVADMSCPGVAGALSSAGCRKNLDHDPYNTRTIVRDFSRPRGTVTTADGVLIAQSVPSNDKYKQQRVFPTKALFASITGYFSFNVGASGIEKQYNDLLSGSTTKQRFRSFSDLFVNRPHTGNLVLTARNDLQTLATAQLSQALAQRGLKEGAAVVLDPRTGAILAMVSLPSYDPNAIASHDTEKAQAVKSFLDAARPTPFLASAYQQLYAPGSTFKLVTGSVGVNTAKVTPTNPSYPVESAYQPPYGNPISNYGGEHCGGTLANILAVSCNSAFAQMGAETIGPDLMTSGAEGFGFNDKPPIDLPAAAASRFPTDWDRKLPLLAQASIGQYDVRATPLQMALVAAGIANDGVIMAPHLLNQVIDDDGNVVQTYKPHQWLRAISSQASATMRDAMVQVVQRGTATILQLPGQVVGAKTGTADNATSPPTTNAWMVAWAGPPGAPPEVVVAVAVPFVHGYGSDRVGSGNTGAAVAGPIAKALLQAALPVVEGAKPAG